MWLSGIRLILLLRWLLVRSFLKLSVLRWRFASVWSAFTRRWILRVILSFFMFLSLCLHNLGIDVASAQGCDLPGTPEYEYCMCGPNDDIYTPECEGDPYTPTVTVPPPTITPTWEYLFGTLTPAPTKNINCPTGQPYGIGTKTPNPEWMRNCSQCITPVPGLKPTKSGTSTPYPSICTFVGTGTPVYKITPDPLSTGNPYCEQCSANPGCVSGTATAVPPTVTPTANTAVTIDCAHITGLKTTCEDIALNVVKVTWNHTGHSWVSTNLTPCTTWGCGKTVNYYVKGHAKAWEYSGSFYGSVTGMVFGITSHGGGTDPWVQATIPQTKSTHPQEAEGDYEIILPGSSKNNDPVALEFNHEILGTESSATVYKSEGWMIISDRPIDTSPTPLPPTQTATANPSAYCEEVQGWLPGEEPPPITFLPIPKIGPKKCVQIGGFGIDFTWVTTLTQLPGETLPENPVIGIPGIAVCMRPITFGEWNLLGTPIDADALAYSLVLIALFRWLFRS